MNLCGKEQTQLFINDLWQCVIIPVVFTFAK